MSAVKQKIKDYVDTLPEDLDEDEIIYRLHFRRMISRGTKDIEEGRTHTQEEMRALVASWFTK